MDRWGNITISTITITTFTIATTTTSTTTPRLERDAISDSSEGYPNMAESLGVQLTDMTRKMPYECAMWDQYAYYHYETPEEIPRPRPPTLLSVNEERQLQDRRQAKGILALLPPGIV